MLTVQLEVELPTFFTEHRRSVRNSDVEVSRTPGLKFWMLLGGGDREVDHVRYVSIVQLPQSSGATHSWIPYWSRTWLGPRRPKQHEVAFAESHKSSRARTEGTARSPYHGWRAQSL